MPVHLHFIGAGGTVTAPLAIALRERLGNISASDEQILSPADRILADAGLEVPDGYSSSHVADTVDFAVIAPFLRRGNPEVEEVLRRRIPYCTWPAALNRLGLLQGRNGVVAGTDGKTTTSCMWTWIMQKAGLATDYLIGGRLPGWNHGVSLRGSKFCVLEGDEYPSGLGDRNPKFAHYKPEVAVLTNIHFDHPDVYSTKEEVMRSFQLLADLLPSDGLLVYNGHDKNCQAVATRANCRTIGFATAPEAEARLERIRHHEAGISFHLQGTNFELPLIGTMNAANAAAAALASRHWGVSLESSSEALRTFSAPEGRQRIFRRDDRFMLMSDTAYHPNAVWELIKAVRKHYPSRRIGLVLQPRHTHGKHNWQQRRWPKVFKMVSEVILLDALNPHGSEADRFSAAELVEEMRQERHHITYAADAATAEAAFRDQAAPGDVWILCLLEWFTSPREAIVEHAMQIS